MREYVAAEPRRVALFSSAFHPSLGGVEELVRQLALEYQKRGIRVVVVTNRWPRNLASAEMIGGVPVLRFPLRLPDGGLRAKWSYRLTGTRVLGAVLRAMKGFAPDVVHVQCVSANAWYASQVAAKMRVPLIVSLQGERTMDAQRIYQRSPLMNRILLNVLRSAVRVTACSGATLQDVARFAPGIITPKTARVVFNGIGSEAFEKSEASVWPRPYILALGRLVPQKGFHVLLESFAHAGLKGLDLLIAGDGPEGARLETSISNSGLSGRAVLVGRADRTRVQALVSRSVGVVVPSLREPMGIVVLEALAAGKPLVASRVDGIPEIVPQSKTVRLVSPGNVSELAEALRWLSHFREATPVPEHIEHARGFCWQKIAEEYLHVYRESMLQIGRGARPCAVANPILEMESHLATPTAGA